MGRNRSDVLWDKQQTLPMGRRTSQYSLHFSMVCLTLFMLNSTFYMVNTTFYMANYSLFI